VKKTFSFIGTEGAHYSYPLCEAERGGQRSVAGVSNCAAYNQIFDKKD
jgi:hypothetical protein